MCSHYLGGIYYCNLSFFFSSLFGLIYIHRSLNCLRVLRCPLRVSFCASLPRSSACISNALFFQSAYPLLSFICLPFLYNSSDTLEVVDRFASVVFLLSWLVSFSFCESSTCSCLFLCCCSSLIVIHWPLFIALKVRSGLFFLLLLVISFSVSVILPASVSSPSTCYLQGERCFPLGWWLYSFFHTIEVKRKKEKEG